MKNCNTTMLKCIWTLALDRGISTSESSDETLTMQRLFCALALVQCCWCFPRFAQNIPNGMSVMHSGRLWPGVGHNSRGGGGPRNSFGAAFKKSKFHLERRAL